MPILQERRDIVKLVYIKEILHSNKKDTDFYIIRIALQENGVIVAKSHPILWLTREQFDKYNI